MNSRIQALGYMGLLFLFISLVYFQLVINLDKSIKPHLVRLKEIEGIVATVPVPHQAAFVTEINQTYEKLAPDVEAFYSYIYIVKWLCIFNLTFGM